MIDNNESLTDFFLDWHSTTFFENKTTLCILLNELIQSEEIQLAQPIRLANVRQNMIN